MSITYRSLLQQGELSLKTCCEQPAWESLQIVLHVCMAQPACPADHAALIMAYQDPVPDAVVQQAHRLLQRRMAEPLAYVLGTWDFYGLRLKLSPETLIPRPETEALVAYMLEHLSAERLSVLELGTGSGAIACALAHERPTWSITATDCHAGTLSIAQANAKHLGLSSIAWMLGDWYEPVEGQRFDVIVSNPPYLPDDDPHLLQLVHEPRRALVSGPEGLEDLRVLISGAPSHLYPGGWLMLEHGCEQDQAVRQLMQAAGLSDVSTQPDVHHQPRFTVGRWL